MVIKRKAIVIYRLHENYLADRGILFFGLVSLDIFFEMAFPNKKFDLILQLGALLRCVLNIFVVGAVLTHVHVRSMS